MSSHESSKSESEPTPIPATDERTFTARFVQHREFESLQMGAAIGQVVALTGAVAIHVLFPVVPLWHAVVAVSVVSWLYMAIMDARRGEPYLPEDGRYRAALQNDDTNE